MDSVGTDSSPEQMAEQPGLGDKDVVAGPFRI